MIPQVPRRAGPASRSRARVFRVALAAATLVTGSAPGAQPGSPPIVVTGALQEEGGETLAHTEVQACSRTLCLYGESDADGRFRFELPAKPAAFVIKTPEGLSSGPGRAAALAPVRRAAGGGPIDMGVVHVPRFAGLRPLPPAGPAQPVEAGNGLEVTMVRGDLMPAPGKSLVALSARLVAPAHVPRYELPEGDKVVAVYALHPFGATSRSPIGVRVRSTLPRGTPVRFRTVREIDGTFSDPVPGHSTGTHLATDAGQGIAELTHVVITRSRAFGDPTGPKYPK